MLAPRHLLAGLAAAALTALAAPAAPASAADVTYDMTTTASGSYAIHKHEEHSGSVTTYDLAFDWRYVADFQDVRFHDRAYAGTGEAPFGEVSITNLSGTFVSGNGTSTNTYQCTYADAALHLDGMLGRQDGGSDGLPAEYLATRPGHELTVMVRCGEGADQFHLSVDLLHPGTGGAEPALGDGPLDLAFGIPREAIGMDYYEETSIVPDPAQVAGAACPGHDTTTTTCALDWTGKVMMTRTGGGDAAPPQPPAGPDPRAAAISGAVAQYGTTPAPKPAPRVDPRAAAISGAVEQYGKDLRFTASCTGGCSGTARLVAGSGSGARPRAYTAALRTLGTLRFQVAPGARRVVKLRLSRKLLRTLRRTANVRVVLTLRPRRGGPAYRGTLPLKRKGRAGAARR